MPNPTITAMLGNLILQPDCDGCINAANEHLLAGGGVRGVIHRAAGPRLEAYTRQHAPLGLGEALASPAFDLPFRYVIHTRGPKYLLDPDPPGNLRKAVINAVRLADQNGLKRLAVPAISTGIYGYPAAEAVPVLLSAAREVLPLLQSLEEIRFVLRNEVILALFLSALDDQTLT